MLAINSKEMPVVESFSDVNDLIWKRCHWYVQTYGGDLEDARSTANESFMIAYERWEPSSPMSFSSYVYQVVTHRFIDEARRNAKRSVRETTVDMVEDDYAAKTESFNYDFQNKDANIVFKHITNDLSDQLKQKHRPETRRKFIVSYFVDNFWWEESRVEKALRLIEDVVMDR